MLGARTMNDARRHARHKIEARADILGTHAWVGLGLRDISVGGCCVEVCMQQDHGRSVDLVVSFPELDTHLALRGVVVHHTPKVSGIRFELSNEDQRWALRNCIRQCLEGGSPQVSAPRSA